MLNPLTGYIMVLQTTGRKSGKTRLTPLNYALADGYIYCMAGFGSGTNWLANLKANPTVEVHLAGATVKGKAEIVTEKEDALCRYRCAGSAALPPAPRLTRDVPVW